jgi:hypothetical protein
MTPSGHGSEPAPAVAAGRHVYGLQMPKGQQAGLDKSTCANSLCRESTAVVVGRAVPASFTRCSAAESARMCVAQPKYKECRTELASCHRCRNIHRLLWEAYCVTAQLGPRCCSTQLGACVWSVCMTWVWSSSSVQASPRFVS